MITAPEDWTGIEATDDWIAGVGSHVGICVPDLEEAREFYCRVLGFEELWGDVAPNEGDELDVVTGIPGLRQRTVMLAVPGGCRIELQDYLPLEEGRAQVNRQGLNHLSFGVRDVWKDFERLKALGVKFRGDPITIEAPGHELDGFVYVYFEDPWGLSLELMAPPSGGSDRERGIG